MRRIAHISDLHFGRHSDAIAEDLLTSIGDHKPDVIAFSGDFTQRARTSEFVQARVFLDRIAQPKLLVPGNHDVPLYNLFSRFLRPFTKYDLHFGSAGQPSNFYADDEIAMLGVNTARSFTRKNGRVSVAQMQQIASVLGALPRDVFKILVTHHPLASPEGTPALELAGRAVAAVTAAKKPACICSYQAIITAPSAAAMPNSKQAARCSCCMPAQRSRRVREAAMATAIIFWKSPQTTFQCGSWNMSAAHFAKRASANILSMEKSGALHRLQRPIGALNRWLGTQCIAHPAPPRLPC